jgi:hypothetical protein
MITNIERIQMTDSDWERLKNRAENIIAQANLSREDFEVVKDYHLHTQGTIGALKTQLNRLKECYNCEIVRGRPCCSKCIHNDFSSDSSMEGDYWREHLSEGDERDDYE